VGARFSAPVQNDPGAHPFSYTLGTGSFQEVKRPGRGVPNHHLHLAPRLMEEYIYTSTLLWVFVAVNWFKFTCTLTYLFFVVVRQYVFLKLASQYLIVMGYIAIYYHEPKI
jgi:hypothetical protein